MRLRIGWLAGAVAFVAVVAGTAWSIWPKPILVETATVTKGRFVATVDEDGKTRIRERYVVAAPLSGRLTRIRLKAGDRVRSDDVIATIFSSPTPLLDPRSRREAEERLGTAEAAQERAKALVDRAQAQSAQADQELTRTRTLVERAASTTQALERAELAKRVADRDLRAAEFQLHATQHELDQTRALLAKYTDSGGSPPDEWSVTAPVSGLVLKVNQESERIVEPGTPILEIGDPSDLEIVVDVLSTDAVEIKPGADVVVEHWGGPGTLSGRVRRVEPAAFTKVSTLGVEEQRVNVLIDILDLPEKISWTYPRNGVDSVKRIKSTLKSSCLHRMTPRSFPQGRYFGVAEIGTFFWWRTVAPESDLSRLFVDRVRPQRSLRVWSLAITSLSIQATASRRAFACGRAQNEATITFRSE